MYWYNSRIYGVDMKQECLKILERFGYSGKGAEECAEEWSSKFNVTFGLVKYYETYFNK